MALTDSEIQTLRFHLGYGNVGFGAYPRTADGFLEVFTNVIANNVQSGSDTTSSTAITANTTTTITLASVTGFAVRGAIIVDVGEEAEITIVKAISGSTITASFAKAHAASGYPVSTESGESRLRKLLYDADTAWSKAQSSAITKTAGLAELGRGQIKWFQSGVLSDTLKHYRSIVQSISDLVRVRPAVRSDGMLSTEIY